MASMPEVLNTIGCAYGSAGGSILCDGSGAVLYNMYNLEGGYGPIAWLRPVE